MYTNGLKDRYGSPLLSLDVGDERYVRMNQIEFEHDKLEEKITLVDRHVQRNTDGITKTNDRLHNINVTVKNHIDDQNVHFTENEKKTFNDTQESVKIFNDVLSDSLERYTEYYTNNFGLQIEGGDVYTSSFRLGNTHLPKGVIRKVSVYARNASNQTHDSKTNGCYLLAHVYKTDGTLVRSYTSKNKVVVVEKQSTDTERPLNTWQFDGIESIADDQVIKFIPTSNGKYQISGYYIGMRIDSSHTHPNCQCGGDDNFANNPLAAGSPWLAFCKFQGDFYSKCIKDSELKNYEKDFLKTIYTKTVGPIFDNNNETSTPGQGQVKGFVLARPYITNGVFNEVRWDSLGTLSWVQNGVRSSSCYMKLTLRDKQGHPIKSIFSNNTENFSTAGQKSYRFNEEFVVTDEVGSILFETSTDQLTASTVAQFRVRVIGNAAKPNTDGTESTNANYAIHLVFWGVTSTSLGGDILTNTVANNTFVSKTDSTNTYLSKTDAANTYLSKTDATNTYATKTSVNNAISELENTVENSLTDVVSKTEYQKHFLELTHYSWSNLKNDDKLDSASVYSFQLDKADFVSGHIDYIEIPYNNGKSKSGHLCVQFFDSSNAEVAKYYSINSPTQDVTNGRSSCSYKFDTFTTPETYSYVRFAWVANNTITPTGTNGIEMRVVPFYRNGAIAWNPNTNTKVNNTGNRWTIALSVYLRTVINKEGITIRNYDWTPDYGSEITVSITTANNVFIAPTNGWIVSKSTTTTSGANNISVNGHIVAQSGSTAQPDLQLLIKKGEYVSASTVQTLTFYPCKSEQYDYRYVINTKYDIWKGAVVYDENGDVSVEDLYIPDASTWKSEVGHNVIGSITRIEDEKAYDNAGNVLFNIQSQYIENGNYMFIQSSITSFDADLGALTRGAQMFAGARLTSWNTMLPSLTSGETMFYACPNLTSFNADVHSLTTGWNMFMNCSNLTTVSFVDSLGALTKLDALTNGTGMFKSCSLSYTSLNNILAALPTRNGNVIEITIADDVKDIMLEDLNWRGVTIPAYNSGNYYEFDHNGWNVRLTSRSGFTVTFGDGLNPDDIVTDYDLSEAKNNITNVSEWGEQVGSNLNIVRVINKIAYNS